MENRTSLIAFQRWFRLKKWNNCVPGQLQFHIFAAKQQETGLTLGKGLEVEVKVFDLCHQRELDR
jgi:hypothetical protein